MDQNHTHALQLSARRALILGAAFVILCSLSAEAGPKRARLSRDLSDRLTTGQTEAVKVIVSGSDQQVQAIAQRHGGRILKRLRGSAVIEIAGSQLQTLSEDADIDHLSGDVPVRRLMTVTAPAIGADQVWHDGVKSLDGYTGRGIGVAIIDSGIAQHKSLRKRVVTAVDFTAVAAPARDDFGHGTHVAGIVAGSADTEYAGVAPEANLVSLKVLNSEGSGDTSDVIAAIDWVVDHRAQYNLRVINLSLGHPVFESYRDDPMCQAVQRAVDAGIVVVAAAGNFGKTEDGRAVIGGIVSPGNSPAALTVGASNTRGTVQRSDDVMATYSSRGPTPIDGLLKPELVAPGNRIVSAAAAGSYLLQTYPERVISGQGSTAFIEMSGTSMAAAVVSGAATLVLDANPRLTPADVKLALQVTSSRLAGAGLIEAGAGNVNVVAAVGLVTGDLTAVTDSVIGGEQNAASGISFNSMASMSFAPQLTANILVWGNAAIATPSSHNTSNILVWGDILVWGNGLVWGNQFTDILVWGNGVASNILVWGNKTIWSENTTAGYILVWGNSTDTGDILVWGNINDCGDILVWGDLVITDD